MPYSIKLWNFFRKLEFSVARLATPKSIRKRLPFAITDLGEKNRLLELRTTLSILGRLAFPKIWSIPLVWIVDFAKVGKIRFNSQCNPVHPKT